MSKIICRESSMLISINNPNGYLMDRHIVILTKDEREALCKITSRGKHNSQKILNSMILLNCDKSEWNS